MAPAKARLHLARRRWLWPFHIRYFALLQSRSVHLLTITVLCVVAVAPFLWWDIPSGHDFEIHVYSWMDALGQWQQGTIYPRWAPSAHWGYGEPRFLFYPPASWMLGAALGSVLPWKIVPGVYCWLTLALAGAAMYRLAERWLRPADALFAAIFYALNPYHLVVIYWRSAYAELLGAGLLPLLLLLVVKLAEADLRTTLKLGVVLAAAWLVNIPVAVMMHYSAAGVALMIAARRQDRRGPLWRFALAVALGTGLAAVYLAPAIWERAVGASWGGAEVRESSRRTIFFLRGPATWITIISTFSSRWWAWRRWWCWGTRSGPQRKERTGNTVWTAAALWGAGAAVMMFRFTDFLWERLPEFRFAQLPFRWLLCLGVPMAFLLAMAGGERQITLDGARLRGRWPCWRRC